jgi:ABC-type amino acid transport substrate-binding protein
MTFVRTTALVLAIASLAFFGSLHAATAQSTLDKAVKEQKLAVCWVDFPPGEYRDIASGQMKGYYFDILNEILSQVNIKPEFVQSDWGTFIAALQAKKCDMSIAGVLMTIPRASAVAFSRPIFYLSSRLLVSTSDSKIKSLDDVIKTAGIKVAVTQGGGGQEFARRTFPKAEIIALASRDQTAPMLEVMTKRADAAIPDAWLGEKFQKEHPESVKIVGETFNVEGVGWSYRHEDVALREFFDLALEKLRLNGTIDALVKQYPESGRFVLDQQLKAVR